MGIPPINGHSASDGDFELSSYNPVTQEYSESPFTQSRGPRSNSRLPGTSKPLTHAPAPKPRSEVPRFRSVHEQVCRPYQWTHGKGFEEVYEALVRFVFIFLPLFCLPWGLTLGSPDLAQDYRDLGAALNGFSLTEQRPGEQQGHLSAALEKTGQANDTTYASTTKLVQELEQNWVEPVHEYSQFASIIRKLLVYRHQKHVQYEMTQDALVAKREQLEELEKSEREARRLEEALGRGRVHRSSSLPGRAAPEEEEGENESGEGGEQDPPMQQSLPSLPPHPGPSAARRRAPGMGFLSALSYTLSGMIDSDPETARRNTISRNRETISQVRRWVLYNVWVSNSMFTARRRDSSLGSRPQVFELDYPGRP